MGIAERMSELESSSGPAHEATLFAGTAKALLSVGCNCREGRVVTMA